MSFYYVCAEKKKDPSEVLCTKSHKEFRAIENPGDYTNFKLLTLDKTRANQGVGWFSLTSLEEKTLQRYYKTAKSFTIVPKDESQVDSILAFARGGSKLSVQTSYGGK